MNSQPTSIFESFPIAKLFRTLAIPTMLTALVNSIYFIVDGIFIGRFVGAKGLAAINLVMPIYSIPSSVINMLAIGSVVLTGIKLGEKKAKEANEIFSFIHLVLLIYVFIIGLLALVFSKDIIATMGASEAINRMAYDYLFVFIITSPLALFNQSLMHYIRTCGKIYYIMWVNLSIALLNILLDYILIVHFHLGIKGAAYATCLSMSLGGILSLIPFLRNSLIIRFIKPRLQFKVLWQSLYNGSSEFFTSIAVSISMGLINIIMLRTVGYMGIASMAIILYIESLIISLMYGMADGIQPALSYIYGMKNYARVFELLKYGIKVGASIAIIVTALVYFYRAQLIHIFSSSQDEALYQMTYQAMAIFVLSFLFSWFNALASLFFTSINRPKESVIISMSHALVFKVIFIAAGAYVLGFNGIYWGFVLSSFASCLLSLYYLIRCHYQLNTVSQTKGANL